MSITFVMKRVLVQQDIVDTEVSQSRINSCGINAILIAIIRSCLQVEGFRRGRKPRGRYWEN